jgi:hypothetical protein
MRDKGQESWHYEAMDFRTFDFGASALPALVLTAREIDLIRSSKEALANFDAAKGDARVLARQRLERIQIDLEKCRDPNTEALRLIKKSLARPINSLTKLGSSR